MSSGDKKDIFAISMERAELSRLSKRLDARLMHRKHIFRRVAKAQRDLYEEDD